MRFTQAITFGLFGAATAQVSTVLSDLSNIKSEVSSLTSALNSYSGGVAAAVPILSASTKLKAAIDQTTSDVGSVGTVSDSDQASVLSAVEGLYPGIISSLQAYVTASGKFPSAIQGEGTSTLQSIQSSTDKLSAALSAKATGQYSSVASTITSDIDAAFKSALAGTSPQAMSLPSIPSGGSSGSGSSSAASSAATSAASSAASSGKASSAAATTTAAASTSAPAAITSSAAAPGYSGAANKVAGSVGGAVLVAAAAFAL